MNKEGELGLLPFVHELETKPVLKKLASAHKALAEFKGVVTSIPNQSILLETLILREARESSAIENIISTYDAVYQSNIERGLYLSPEAKEVQQYAQALRIGFDMVKGTGLLTNNTILKVQEVIEQNNAGFRKLPGTKLLNDESGEIVYTPPQDHSTIINLMDNLVVFINDNELSDLDPLVKMAVIHHQFESIHPFYDGNGRTGRIINILYLVHQNLLNLPVLYLSKYVIKNKTDYYRLLQHVRDTGEWEEWILFILEGVNTTSMQGVMLVTEIKDLMQHYKQIIRKELPKIYSQDLLNNLFKYPYTKIEYLQHDLGISRSTAIRHLDSLSALGLLIKRKVGRDNFYLNEPLFRMLSKQ